MPKKNPRIEAVPSTLQEAAVYFSDPIIALMYFVTLRWPDGNVTCPTCGSQAVRFIATRNLWRCGGPNHKRQQFSVKIGTIMEDSPIGLDKWLLAMWMVTNCKNGISSYEMARALGVTQKSAWFLNHRIRKAMQEDGTLALGGSGKIVEVDETFIGGAARKMNAKQLKRSSLPAPPLRNPNNPPKRTYSFTSKAIVMGMLERGGKVVAKVVKIAFQAGRAAAYSAARCTQDRDSLGRTWRLPRARYAVRSRLRACGCRSHGPVRRRADPHQRHREFLVALEAWLRRHIRLCGAVPPVPVLG